MAFLRIRAYSILTSSCTPHSSRVCKRLLVSNLVRQYAFRRSIVLLTSELFRQIAAYFVQHAVAAYEHHHSQSIAVTTEGEAGEGVQDEVAGKEAANLIVLMSELYNFQVISCVLVFDLVRALLFSPSSSMNEGITELNVELLLKIVRSTSHRIFFEVAVLTVLLQIRGNN